MLQVPVPLHHAGDSFTMNELHNQQITSTIETPRRYEPGMGLPPKLPETWAKVFELLLNQRGIENIHQPGEFDRARRLLQERIQDRKDRLTRLQEEMSRENAMDLARIEALQRFAALHELPQRFLEKQIPREWAAPPDAHGRPSDVMKPLPEI